MTEPRRTIALGPPYDDGTIPPALTGKGDVPTLTTTAGKKLRTDMGLRGKRRDRLTRYILAIEQEAAKAERERLRHYIEAARQGSNGHLLDPRCSELMPTDGTCDCGLHGILEGD